MGLVSKKNLLGLDVGSKSTKIAQLAFAGGKARLSKCAVAETGLDDDGFVGNLRSFLVEHKVRGLPVAASFDDPSIIIRKMELPKMPDADFQEALRWNLRDLVEGDPSEYTVTHSLIRESQIDNEHTTMQIVAYAAKRDSILSFKSKIEQAGLSVQMVEPESVTLAWALDRCEPNETGYVAGVDVGRSHSLFYVVGQRLFLFSRPMKGIDLSLYDKEPADFSQRLAIEVQKSIDTFQVNFEMQSLDALYLSGGGALIEGLDSYLETNMGIKTKILNPFEMVSGTEAFADLPAPLFAKAMGLAYAQI